MKKKSITIATLGLIALLSCIVCFHYACRRDQPDCSKCQITPQEEAQLPAYTTGDIAVFKNDITGVLDTLHVTSKGTDLSGCEDPCENTAGGLSIRGIFLHNHFSVSIWHNSKPGSAFPSIVFDGVNFCFPLSGIMQSMTVNSASYNDVYVTSIDSTKIYGDLNQVPWKINYSKSNGIIRCYMVNGQTWSKL